MRIAPKRQHDFFGKHIVLIAGGKVAAVNVEHFWGVNIRL